MAARKTIKPSMTIAGKVLRQLEHDIIYGVYKPGDHLVEREISEKLGVSRIPVREALLNLERWGFVTGNTSSRKGREVVGLTYAKIRELYQILLYIEISSFAEAAIKKNSKLKEILWNLIDQMDEAASRKALEEYRELNTKFHHEVVKSTANRRLFQMFNDLSKMERWFQNVTLYFPRMKKSNSEHKGLMQAYEKCDVSEIHKKYSQHYYQAIDVLGKKLSFSK